ncbi:MAG TPA: hypothetical protein VFW95_11305 [Candidatus Limnocylindria bacterium]|nr:hypothetical protein [Candidatus Limnocylindria bacterium]
MTSGRLSRPLARLAAALWIAIAAVYTILLLGYLYALLTEYVRPPLAEAVIQLLVYASIAGPGWFLCRALWTRPSWRIAIASAVIGGLLFLLLVGTLLGIVALAAGLLPLLSMAVRAPLR